MNIDDWFLECIFLKNSGFHYVFYWQNLMCWLKIWTAFLWLFFCIYFVHFSCVELILHHFAAPETLKDKLKIIIYQLRMTSYPVKEMQIQHCQFWGKKWCEGGEFKGLSLFRVVVTYIQSRRFDGIFGWQIVKST